VISGPNGSGNSTAYRSLCLLAQAVLNTVVASLAREGGLPSTFCAGPETIARGVRQETYVVEPDPESAEPQAGLRTHIQNGKRLAGYGLLSPTAVRMVNTGGFHVINQPVAARPGLNRIHAAKLASRCSVNPRGVFGTTQAALNEAAHEWRTRRLLRAGSGSRVFPAC